jgi:hypothetical protein
VLHAKPTVLSFQLEALIVIFNHDYNKAILVSREQELDKNIDLTYILISQYLRTCVLAQFRQATTAAVQSS